MTPAREEFVARLARARQGDQAALEELAPLVQKEIHRLAKHYLGGERSGHVLQPTAMINEDTPNDCMEVVEVTVAGDYSFFFYQILRLFGANVPNQVSISRGAQMPYHYQPYANGTRCTGTSVNLTYENV